MGTNKISQLGLGAKITQNYSKKGIETIYPWQADCLSRTAESPLPNLVLLAPTGSGKTLVSEVLMFRQIQSQHAKALVVLPFVSLAEEQVGHLECICGQSRLKVGGFFGNISPIGGFNSVDIAICTIEKANNIVNRLQLEESLDKICFVLVDEVHMISDSSRGHILEILLTKLLYHQTISYHSLKIVAMTATLRDGHVLATWLKAEFFSTDFRASELSEFVSVGDLMYNKDKEIVRKLAPKFGQNWGNLIDIVFESLLSGESVVIFSSSKSSCESLALGISNSLDSVLKGGVYSEEETGFLRNLAGRDLHRDLLEELKEAAGVVDQQLLRTVRRCVAFHHAGLTVDERSVLEDWIRKRRLRVVVATYTLASGVNLPFQRVIIAFNSVRNLSPEVYRQMIGRAGRSEAGESYLICQEREKSESFSLVNADFSPLESSLKGNRFRRAIFEMVAGLVNQVDFDRYLNCTFLLHVGSLERDNIRQNADKVFSELFACNFVKSNDDGGMKVTQLGYAAFQAGLDLSEAQSVLRDVENAAKCLNLEDDLHLIYLVTPPTISNEIMLSWCRFYDIWASLPQSAHSVAHSIGITEKMILNGVTGRLGCLSQQNLCRRFYCSLALLDLIKERPLAEVADKFGIIRGTLQSLQRSSSVFAVMTTTFCECVGRTNMALLLQQLRVCLHFGVERELSGLMRLNLLTVCQARALFRCGFATVAQVAMAEPTRLVRILAGESVVADDHMSADLRVLVENLMANAREILREDLLGFNPLEERKDDSIKSDKVDDICDSLQSLSLFGDSLDHAGPPKRNSLELEFSTSFTTDDPPIDLVQLHPDELLPKIERCPLVSLFPVYADSAISTWVVQGDTTFAVRDAGGGEIGRFVGRVVALGVVVCLFNCHQFRLLIQIKRRDKILVFDPKVYHGVMNDGESLSLEELSSLYMGDDQICRVFPNSEMELAVKSAKTVLELSRIMLNSKVDKSLLQRELLFRCFVLPTVECVGMKTDKLYSLLETSQQLMMSMSHKINKISNKSISLESPAEISKFLYVQLKLPPPSSAHSSESWWNDKLPFISTDKLTLEPLRHLHSVVDLIISWRKLFSVNQLLRSVERHVANSRVFGQYDTFSASGRFHTTCPNLQCTPKKFSVNCVDIAARECFVAEEGCLLLSADYSQLELRIIAHLSGDERLRSILVEGGDVFRRIAAQWAHVDESVVSQDLRQKTKMLCYGIIYGMGAASLSSLVGESVETAREMIESFLEDFRGLECYIRDTVAKCRASNGVVRTLFGSFRRLADILSRDGQARARAQRQAVNFTVQGTAAELMKMCLVELSSRLDCLCSKQMVVLVVHDEFVLEVPEDLVHQVSSIVRSVMEGIVELAVPLSVKILVGRDWGNLV